ncbi:MAG: hypothetical protein UT00_C0012G0014 [Parcubacteria group bacterium GW2011_GWA1_38_7]|nr:MAG: hypothetical protein UT00_C0012G0014 [Parcubacteria group bacterium GW2011_GWA1_38_7]
MVVEFDQIARKTTSQLAESIAKIQRLKTEKLKLQLERGVFEPTFPLSSLIPSNQENGAVIRQNPNSVS